MKLLEFPLVPLTDIPARLRLLAEQVEDGEFGEVLSLAVVVENDTEVRPILYGKDGDQLRFGGLLAFAMHSVFESGGT